MESYAGEGDGVSRSVCKCVCIFVGRLVVCLFLGMVTVPASEDSGSPYQHSVLLAGKHLPLFHAPDPDRQCAVDGEVYEHGPECRCFRRVPA